MIICHRYKFIFLKTTKTAGTSIEIALSQFCDDGDIITPIAPADECVRKELGYPGPQNFMLPVRTYSPSDIFKLFARGSRKRFYNHMPARRVKPLITRHIWNDYFKFCFERNPWDRVISAYFWQYKSDPRPSLREFIDSGTVLQLKRKGFEIYTINGDVVVNKLCRYERLREELDRVAMEVGLPGGIVLPKTKHTYRKDKRPYRDLFDDESREKVARMFARERQLCEYEF